MKARQKKRQSGVYSKAVPIGVGKFQLEGRGKHSGTFCEIRLP